MRITMVEQRIGENMGKIDWSHEMAKIVPAMWRDAEASPDDFLFEGRGIIEIGMYDGWPYWKPTPAIHFHGPIGPEWAYFDSYGVNANSIAPRRSGSAP